MFRCTWVPTYSRAHAEKCRSLPVLFRSFIFEAWLFRQVTIIKKKKKKSKRLSSKDERKKMDELHVGGQLFHNRHLSVITPVYRLSFPFLSLSVPFLLIFATRACAFFPSSSFSPSIHSKTGKNGIATCQQSKVFFSAGIAACVFSPSHFSSLLSDNRR